MHLVFLKINESPAEYASAKYRASVAHHAMGVTLQMPNETLNNVLQQLTQPAPRLAMPEEFFAVDKRQSVLIEAAKSCADMEVLHRSPLLDSEELGEDFYSYLLEPYLDYPVQTAVLRRTTSKATMLYIFPDVQIIDGDIVKQAAQMPELAEVPEPLAAAPSTLQDFVKDMLKKAGGTIASKAGAFVLNLVLEAIFGKQDDFAALLEQIKEVIEKAIEKNELAKVEGKIRGTVDFLAIDYKRLKEKSDLSKAVDRERLIDELKPYYTGFNTDVIGLIMGPKYSRPGLYSFLIASPIQLVIIQEMALVDPNFFNPNDSAYLNILHDRATQFKNHVSNVYYGWLKERENKVHTTSTPSYPMPGNYVSWLDEETGKKGITVFISAATSKQDAKALWDKVVEDMKRHIQNVLAPLKEQMGFPENNFLPEIPKLETYKFDVK